MKVKDILCLLNSQDNLLIKRANGSSETFIKVYEFKEYYLYIKECEIDNISAIKDGFGDSILQIIIN